MGPEETLPRSDRVVRGLLGQTLRSIAHTDLDVQDIKTGQVGSCANYNVGPALHTSHEAGQVGEERRLEAVARADFEDELRTRKYQSLDHLRHE